MGLFTRRRKQATDTGGLGTSLIALRLDAGDVAPAGATVVIFNAGGHARRAAAGRVSFEQGETVFCFHPGPYTVDLMPFAAAPEWGLRLRFVIDAANPRVTQQRFDLYLFSETAGTLAVAGFGATVEMALQAELAQGALDLPPCTSLEEWHAFRAGLNQLMYTRYGVTVDDCVPVDLGGQVDFAEVLKARAPSAARMAPELPEIHTLTALADSSHSPAPQVAEAKPPHAPAGNWPPSESSPSEPLPPESSSSKSVQASRRASTQPSAHAQRDAQALRRLFLELPAVTSELRLLTLPEGLPIFQRHQSLLLRLGMASLNVGTMPALAWAAPDQPLEPNEQSRRGGQSLVAVAALDEGWSLLARLHLARLAQWPDLLDEADRVLANLETGLALRRMPRAPQMEPTL